MTGHTASMNLVDLILLLIAAICFALVAFGVSGERINLLGLGLFCWVLVPLIAAIQHF